MGNADECLKGIRKNPVKENFYEKKKKKQLMF